jgi:uncharacterized protein (TIGR02266 family)
MAICPACRSEIPDDSRFCDQCGFRLAPYPDETAPESSPDEVVLLTRRRDQDRRGTIRFPLQVEVTYASEHNFYTGLTSNLSSGGLFVSTHQPAALGDVVEVTFTLPGLAPCTARCEVRWVRVFDPDNLDAPPGLGLRFLELDAHVWSSIGLFIRHREPLFFDDE